MTNWESGEKDASSGRLLELRWPVKVCSVAPVKASIRRMSDPFVEMRIVLPSGLNLNEEKGPLSKLLRSYSLTLSELMPAAKMRPSGSKAATGRPARCMRPWQLADLRSHSRMVLSRLPLRKDSSVGDMQSVTTRLLW